jgi:Reverse transcriptase (RNA-dependent DNA polymerase)
MAIATQSGLELEQIDVDGAFLNGLTDAEICMHQPLGYVNPQFPNHVCKLAKGIYGLKQAGRIWHAAIRQVFIGLGLNPLNSASCIFTAQ